MLAQVKNTYESAETMHTFAEWEAIHQRKQRRRKAERIYYIKQKLMGLAAVVISVLCPLLMDGDATASLFILPLGLYLLFTKEKVMMF